MHEPAELRRWLPPHHNLARRPGGHATFTHVPRRRDTCAHAIERYWLPLSPLLSEWTKPVAGSACTGVTTATVPTNRPRTANMVSKRDFMMSSCEFRHERKFLTGGTLLAAQTPRPELFHTTWPAGGRRGRPGTG